ncbi:hypothetical protein D3C80_518720 [compost metagenome]
MRRERLQRVLFHDHIATARNAAHVVNLRLFQRVAFLQVVFLGQTGNFDLTPIQTSWRPVVFPHAVGVSIRGGNHTGNWAHETATGYVVSDFATRAVQRAVAAVYVEDISAVVNSARNFLIGEWQIHDWNCVTALFCNAHHMALNCRGFITGADQQLHVELVGVFDTIPCGDDLVFAWAITVFATVQTFKGSGTDFNGWAKQVVFDLNVFRESVNTRLDVHLILLTIQLVFTRAQERFHRDTGITGIIQENVNVEMGRVVKRTDFRSLGVCWANADANGFRPFARRIRADEKQGIGYARSADNKTQLGHWIAKHALRLVSAVVEIHQFNYWFGCAKIVNAQISASGSGGRRINCAFYPKNGFFQSVFGAVHTETVFGYVFNAELCFQIAGISNANPVTGIAFLRLDHNSANGANNLRTTDRTVKFAVIHTSAGV